MRTIKMLCPIQALSVLVETGNSDRVHE
uniref:Uncharacterized protein n=1 Tax=Arundo donax TaxID=35708 RepID=A0A0A9B294_ARUDO